MANKKKNTSSTQVANTGSEPSKMSDILMQIKKYDKIIICRHTDPDPDAYGSQLGLAAVLKASFPKKTVLCDGHDDKGLRWLGKMDNVTADDYQGALVIVTDTANAPRVDSDYWSTKAKEVIKIDHHPVAKAEDKYGDIQWVNPQASSASEMVAIFTMADDRVLKMTKHAASLLYAGIVGDTGRFMYPETRPLTFYTVFRLAQLGIPKFHINQHEIQTDLATARLSGYLEQHMRVFSTGFAYYLITQEQLDNFNILPSAYLSKNLPSNIKGIKCWAAIVQQRDGEFKVSLRSNGPAVNKIAEKYNGGGHALASGAKADAVTDLNALLKDMNHVTAKYNEVQNDKTIWNDLNDKL